MTATNTSNTDRPAATIRAMTDHEARAVARLHAESITEGFLSRLGPRFLAEIYRGVAHDAESHVWVADDQGVVGGFCAYSRRVGGMYKRILRARFLRLGIASLPRSLNFWVLREMLDTVRYPAKQAAQELPPAEILSIAVDASQRGTGVGRRLLEAALEQARQDGEPQIKVLAGAALDGANRFYQSCGFACTTQLVQHGHPLNVYVREVAAG